MKVITQHESVVTDIKSCLIFQIPRFVLINKYHVSHNSISLGFKVSNFTSSSTSEIYLPHTVSLLDFE